MNRAGMIRDLKQNPITFTHFYYFCYLVLDILLNWNGVIEAKFCRFCHNIERPPVLAKHWKVVADLSHSSSILLPVNRNSNQIYREVLIKRKRCCLPTSLHNWIEFIKISRNSGGINNFICLMARSAFNFPLRSMFIWVSKQCWKHWNTNQTQVIRTHSPQTQHLH